VWRWHDEIRAALLGLEPDRGSLTISGRGYLALQYDNSGRHVLLV
jgi:hypothetical protein